MTARLFSVPSFRFSLDGAIGKWSRIATMGEKAKDGARMVFDATTLGQMVDNAAERGDPIAINADHASAYPETRDAPALGFFGALAVVEGGKVVKSWNGSPDASGLDDGLYARLDRVTPRGADPTVGLANFAALSPMFSENASDERGREIGFALYDVAATNVPFQSGCAIQFHGAPSATPGAHAMANVQPADMDRIKQIVQSSGGSLGSISATDNHWVASFDGPDAKQKADALVASAKQSGSYAEAHASSPTRAIVSGLIVRMSATPAAATTMSAYFAPGERVEVKQSGDRGTVVEMKPNRSGVNVVWVKFEDGETRDVIPDNLKKMSAAPPLASKDTPVTMAQWRETNGHGAIIGFKNPFGSSDFMQVKKDGVQWSVTWIQPSGEEKVIGRYGSDSEARSAAEVLAQMKEAKYRADYGDKFKNYSRSTSAPTRRFNQGAPMDPEKMAARFGFEPNDDAETKLAKCMAGLADEEVKAMGELEIVHKDEEDEKEAEAMAADLGVEPGPKMMSRMRAALSATRAPVTAMAALQGEVKALSAKLAERDKADADAKLNAFATDAINAGQWDPEKREALITFARADMKAAQSSLLPAGTYTALARITAGLDSRGNAGGAVPDANGVQRFGVKLSDAAKKFARDNKVSFEKALAEVAKDPALASDYIAR